MHRAATGLTLLLWPLAAMAQPSFDCAQAESSAARPWSRSSKILGSANVVAWKMIEETAVVVKTIAATRISRAR